MTNAEIAYSTFDSSIDARNQLIMSEMPQVRYIAARIHERLPKHVPIDDLVNAGVIGLIDAYRNFDPNKNIQFKSFARFRVRGAIIDSLRELDWGSRPLRRKNREMEDAICRLESRLGRQPSELEIAGELKLDLDEFHKLAAKLDALEIVSQQVTSAYDGSDTHDLIESAPSPDENPFQLCLKAEMKKHLVEAVGKLTEREQMVMSLYYEEELTMKEIADVLSVAESRVSQLHSVALKKLKASLRNASSSRGRA